jgi:hypothetical protein
MASFAARNARCEINGVKWYARKWTVNLKADELDVTTFEDGGYANFLAGMVTAEINVEGFFQDNLSPLSNLSLYPGSILTNLKLYLNNAAGLANAWPNNGFLPASFFLFPSVIVLSADTMADVKGALEFNFNARNKGSFTMP